MPRARRQDIYRLQAHSLSDAVGCCTGALPLAKSHLAEWPMLLCPLCLDWFNFPDLDEDHAPPAAGQSSLGPAQVVVMTCRADNQNPGHSYESAAHQMRNVLTAVPDPLCPVHQRERATASGLIVVTDRAAFDLTDVRAAYLISFATLGHRWVLSPRLDNLRRRLREADLRFASTDYEILCVHDVGTLKPFHVYEVKEPVPAILVTGAHVSVLLPCQTSPADIRGVIVERTLNRIISPTRRVSA